MSTNWKKKENTSELICSQCGDLLEVGIITKYKRISYVTVFGAGAGGYLNLLRIVPHLTGDVDGAFLVVLHEPREHVDAFTDYLDAVSNIKVLRMTDGMSLEGGHCYLASAEEQFVMKSHSAHYTIRTMAASEDMGPVDSLMKSVATVFKEKVAGMVLSGSESDGEKGIKAIKKENGLSIVLNSANCLGKEMGENILRKCEVDKIVDERDVAEFLTELHQSPHRESITA